MRPTLRPPLGPHPNNVLVRPYQRPERNRIEKIDQSLVQACPEFFHRNLHQSISAASLRSRRPSADAVQCEHDVANRNALTWTTQYVSTASSGGRLDQATPFQLAHDRRGIAARNPQTILNLCHRNRRSLNIRRDDDHGCHRQLRSSCHYHRILANAESLAGGRAKGPDALHALQKRWLCVAGSTSESSRICTLPGTSLARAVDSMAFMQHGRDHNHHAVLWVWRKCPARSIPGSHGRPAATSDESRGDGSAPAMCVPLACLEAPRRRHECETVSPKATMHAHSGAGSKRTPFVPLQRWCQSLPT